MSNCVRARAVEHNGNGNGYFHNAYFLRLVQTRIFNTTFHASTGHGLKITQQNDTIIDGCTVTDNRWQGIWVGQESRGNFGLTIAVRCPYLFYGQPRTWTEDV